MREHGAALSALTGDRSLRPLLAGPRNHPGAVRGGEEVVRLQDRTEAETWAKGSKTWGPLQPNLWSPLSFLL